MKTKMTLSEVAKQSDLFSQELISLISVPRFDDSDKVRVSDIACTMSLEHWNAARLLLTNGLLPSGVVVLRAQFEALVRSIWILYAASDVEIAKLANELSLESEKAAKNMPLVTEMMDKLSIKAPPQAFDALNRFKESAWRVLNSYAHAGIHPLRRHEEGYPLPLVEDTIRNSNALAVVTGMQAVVLSGQQGLVKQVIDMSQRHSACMPPSL